MVIVFKYIDGPENEDEPEENDDNKVDEYNFVEVTIMEMKTKQNIGNLLDLLKVNRGICFCVTSKRKKTPNKKKREKKVELFFVNKAQ
jgi:hypothetical protein